MLIFVLVTAITVLSVFAIERGEAERDAADVARKAQAMTSAIERRAYTSSAYLRAGAALLSTQDEITPELFRRFVSELRLDANYRGAEGIGWAPVVNAGELPEFEARLSRSRVEEQRVAPSLAEQPRDMLTPILYLQPDTVRNRRAHWATTCMPSPCAARRWIWRRTIVPPPAVRSCCDRKATGDAAGFLVYMPVLKASAARAGSRALSTARSTRGNFSDLASELVSYEAVGARLLDTDATAEPALAQSDSWIDGRATVTREVSLANRMMLLEVQSAREEGLSSMSMITLLFGLAVASLLMLVSRLLTQQTLEDRRAISWFEEQNSIRNSLTRELNHRVKNTLANVLSIVSLTRRRSDDLDEFAEGLDGRIRALSATHDLLTQSEWGTTPIRSVVEVELAPYARDEDHSLELVGPHTELAPNDALSLGLAIHELATNAAKFGALSVAGGNVTVCWTRSTIRWPRSNGSKAAGPGLQAAASRLRHRSHREDRRARIAPSGRSGVPARGRTLHFAGPGAQTQRIRAATPRSGGTSA